MRLIIAEKPSLARAIAEAHPQTFKRHEGYLESADTLISWCFGHLLEQAPPDAYDPAHKRWAREHLPIVPRQWQLLPRSQSRAQLTLLKRLIKQADQLVHAGDPDREGQLLVDEVINHANTSKAKCAGTLRCLVNDMNPAAIRRALDELRPNSEFIPLATSALARARADWLYGINMTRLCTLLGQQAGYTGVLSIGRVQTPVLGLVVQRDQEIDQFVSKPYYEVSITLLTQHGESFNARWKPGDAQSADMDDEGRILSRQLADTIVHRVTGKIGQVAAVTREPHRQAPPLPYNLSALQIDASRRFNLNAQKTLDICQQLYERHRLITYPRSDCRYLPSGHYNERQAVCQAIGNTDESFSEALEAANPGLRSRAWNDARVGAHHAIIPTSRSMDNSRLSHDEKRIYALIARQYLMQFYPAFEYSEHQIDSRIDGELFVARRKTVIKEGWKALLPPPQAPQAPAKQDEFDSHALPDVKPHDPVTCQNAARQDKQTTPPRPFTDASLLAAMTGIARFVADPEIKKVLRDTDGLGTEATRAGIIELLFKRQFLTKQGKEIHATEIGRQLINCLAPRMVVPDMTAHWESQLEAISERRLHYNDFINPLAAGLNTLIEEVSQRDFSALNGMGSKPRPGGRKRPGTGYRRASSSTQKRVSGRQSPAWKKRG